MNNMIYNFKTHSISNSKKFYNVYYLTIGFLEIIFDFKTNELLGLEGFFPLIKSEKCNIKLPKCVVNKYFISNIDKAHIYIGGVYDYCGKVMDHADYFINQNIKYDAENGIIALGDDNILSTDKFIQIDKNIICMVDLKNILKRIYIVPDGFICRE